MCPVVIGACCVVVYLNAKLQLRLLRKSHVEAKPSVGSRFWSQLLMNIVRLGTWNGSSFVADAADSPQNHTRIQQDVASQDPCGVQLLAFANAAIAQLP